MAERGFRNIVSWKGRSGRTNRIMIHVTTWCDLHLLPAFDYEYWCDVKHFRFMWLWFCLDYENSMTYSGEEFANFLKMRKNG